MAATLIPYSWISTPLNRNPTQAVNAPIVTQTGGAVGRARDRTSISKYGYGAPQIDLQTACDADPGVLAQFLVTYQATPRPLQPSISFNLMSRQEAEAQRILAVGFGQWVQISGAPSNWPPGAANFTVIGIHHTIGVGGRTVDWYTSALIGSAPTAPGPWFKWDTSSWDGTDIRPF